MRRRLPPLKALRAFEAAARHLSFTRAGAELHVTQAAISHQVKMLEEDLGVRLFRRLTRRLTLTDEGRRLLPVVRESFERIAAATDALREQRGTGTLTVTVMPRFAAKWLAPRLGRFWQQHPGIDLRLHHTIQAEDFSREDVDMAVRWGRGEWSGMRAEFLLGAELTPVCSPKLLRARQPLRTLADLRHHALLYDGGELYNCWVQWLHAAGVHRLLDTLQFSLIDDVHVLIERAIDGDGLALVPVLLLGEELDSGRLIRPFDCVVTDFAYHIVYPRDALRRPTVRAFRDWLLDEARRHRAVRVGAEAPRRRAG